jgi:hypothetical protein
VLCIFSRAQRALEKLTSNARAARLKKSRPAGVVVLVDSPAVAESAARAGTAGCMVSGGVGRAQRALGKYETLVTLVRAMRLRKVRLARARSPPCKINIRLLRA